MKNNAYQNSNDIKKLCYFITENRHPKIGEAILNAKNPKIVRNRSNKHFDSFNEWLSSFPSTWIEYIYCNSTYPVVKIKECLVIHQIYALPGRKTVDEEYFIISPNNKILEYNSIYSPYKGIEGSFVQSLVSSDINPWANVDVIIDNKEPCYFHAAKPNYGHAILDCLPDILAVGDYIIKNNGSIYTGFNPDKSLIDALQIVQKELIGYCVPPEIHGRPSDKSWRSYKVKNLILPPHRSRTEKVDYLKYFIPKIELVQQTNPRMSKENIYIQRKTTHVFMFRNRRKKT